MSDTRHNAYTVKQIENMEENITKKYKQGHDLTFFYLLHALFPLQWSFHSLDHKQRLSAGPGTSRH